MSGLSPEVETMQQVEGARIGGRTAAPLTASQLSRWVIVIALILAAYHLGGYNMRAENRSLSEQLNFVRSSDPSPDLAVVTDNVTLVRDLISRIQPSKLTAEERVGLKKLKQARYVAASIPLIKVDESTNTIYVSSYAAVKRTPKRLLEASMLQWCRISARTMQAKL